MPNSTDTYLCIRSLGRTGDDAAYLALTGGGYGGTDTGLSVNHYNALEINPVWSAVSLISGDVAKLPLNMYQRAASNSRERELATMHPAQQLVRWQANPEMSAFRFWRRMMTHLLLWNRAYAFIERDAQYRPIGLYPLLPDRTGIYYDDRLIVYFSEIDGMVYPFNSADILDFQGIRIDDRYPEQCDLVRAARDNFALGLAAQKFGSKFFANGANVGGILIIPPGFSEQAADNLVEGFRKKHTSVDNAFKTAVFRDGAKFESTQVEPEKSQFHETREAAVADVARWYNLPPHKLGLNVNTSYSSLEQENRSYLDSCLMPWLETISSQCWMKLLSTPEQQSGRYYFEHNTRKLLAADTITQYQVGQIAIQSGIMSVDEFRATQNMNPRPDGLGGEYFYSNNMQPVTEDTFSPESELISSVRTLFEQSEKRIREKANRARRKKPEALEDHRTAYVTELTEYAKPLSLLTGQPVELIAAQYADNLFQE